MDIKQVDIQCNADDAFLNIAHQKTEDGMYDPRSGQVNKYKSDIFFFSSYEI